MTRRALYADRVKGPGGTHMSKVVWRIHLRRQVLDPVAAAVQAFCIVRRSDTTATIFEVDGEVVDLTERLQNDPDLHKSGERAYYLLPPGGEGRAAGPFAEEAVPDLRGGQILMLDHLTGVVSVRWAR